MTPRHPLAPLHAMLCTFHAQVWDEAHRLLKTERHGLSPGTLFALGEVAGIAAKARALVGRDIDASPLAPPQEGTADDGAI